MIFRALQELMGNAARHNEDHAGKVQITASMSPEDNAIKVSVSDNGKGFDPSILEDGSGLGLKVIRERVEMLGGFFEIDSSPGQGCRVSFQVPSLDLDNAIK
jgi:signal transduction histidine kinase